MNPTFLGHYELLEKIGQGGMGIVYRARDLNLERFVAVKILPPETMADADRKRRFVREARAASALNHPNIVTVHDISSHEGVDFMVMELIAGRSLDRLIGRDGMSVAEVLRYGIQVADALAQAHAAGIVHRDLKPGNVMVTEGGLVKLLDFGLAKLSGSVAGGAGATEALTESRLTMEGAVVGTVAYMSPEQAQGLSIDSRSDVFSFGAVLYEMVTGRRAFQGESSLAVLSAVLEKEPAPVGSLARQVPPELDRLILRCLRKDRERRPQHMGDVKLALQELKDDPESGRTAVPVRARSRALPWAAVGAGLLAVAVVGTTWLRTRPPPAPDAPVLTRLTWDPGLATEPALSPDGRLLAYASDRAGEGNLDLYVQQVGGGAPLRLTRDPADDHEPAFSPDGTLIVFRSEKDGGGIYIVSALGGPARLAASGGRKPKHSPDGNWIAYWVGPPLGGAGLSIRDRTRVFVVPAAGGLPRQVQPGFVAAAYPVWSADSRHLLFLGNSDFEHPPEESVDWWVTPLDGGPAVKTGALEATRAAGLTGGLLVFSWALVEPAWEPDGESLVFSANHGDSTNLWRIGISPKTFRVTGPPQRVTSGPTREEGPSMASAPGGGVRFAFASLDQNLSLWSLPVDANSGRVTGELKRLTPDAADNSQPALSSDGARMVFISTRTGYQEIWIRDMRSGEESALTATRTLKYAPRFSPDGSKVGFAVPGTWNAYVMSSTGGEAEMVCEGCGQVTGWSSDGKRILCNALDGKVYLLDLASRRKTALIARAGRWLCCGDYSPDDRWITFFDGTDTRMHVVPSRGDEPAPDDASIEVLADANGGQWSPDGNLVYTLSSRDGHVCVWAQRLDPLTRKPAGSPIAVFHSHDARLSLSNHNENSLTGGPGQIVFSMGERTGTIWMAEWKDR